MNNAFPYKIYSCGDHAITVDFGNVIDEAVNKHVLRLFTAIKEKNIPGVKDIIPAYSSITLVYDVVLVRRQTALTAHGFIIQKLETILTEALDETLDAGRLIKIPACYESVYAPDLQEMAMQKNISPEQIVQIHCSKQYRVYMLGFLPGFAYMGIVDESISMPRRSAPRTRIPAGSIGIAGLQTGIYPMESPGGWNLIGRTALKMFDATRANAVLLQPGDYVQFYPITTAEFNTINGEQ